MLFYQDVLSELSVVQCVALHGDLSFVLVDLLTLDNTIVLDRAITNVNISQMVTLVSYGQRCIIASAQNSLSLSQEGREVKWETVDDTLSFISLGTGYLTNPVSNNLIITHNVQVSILYNNISTLVLGNLVTCQLIAKAYRVQDGPLYNIPHNPIIQLTYGSITLILRNPSFGDNDVKEFRRINRRSRGNALHIFRDPIWPVANRINYTFNDLSDKDKSTLLSFIENSIGQQITLVDYEQRNWLGVIITPSADIKQTLEQDNSVTLQFEGLLV